MSEERPKKQKPFISYVTKKLDEHERGPKIQIRQIIEECGMEFVAKLLEDTLRIEAEGGMMINNGERRRTTGGVFFRLARERLPLTAHLKVFNIWQVRKQANEYYQGLLPTFDLESRRVIYNRIKSMAGRVADVKITLVGRPGEIERRQDLVITTMYDADFEEELELPKGVPQPPQLPKQYLVYIAGKQWDRFSLSISPDDELIVDGYLAYDEEIQDFAVFATYATTKRMAQKEGRKRDYRKNGVPDKHRKAKQKNKPQTDDVKKEEPKDAEAKSAETKADKPRPQAPPMRPITAEKEKTESDVDVPQAMTDEQKQKYIGLIKAVETYRQRIADLEAQPIDKQFGLAMTQKLLANIEKQINTMRSKYDVE